MMAWFFRNYLRTPQDGKSPYVSPLQASAQALPDATIILAEIDPLCSEGADYARKLKASGVETDVRLYKGTTHEFFGMKAVVADAQEAQKHAGERLQAAFLKK